MKRLLFLIPCLLSAHAMADEIVASPGEQVSLSVNSDVGSVIQLPSSVRTITPSRSFVISQLGADIDRTTGQAIDVRTFQVRAVPGGKTEDVTFVLANGQSLKTRLTVMPNSDKYHSIAFRSDRTKRAADARFLTAEVSLLRAMIVDGESGTGRQVQDRVVELVGTPKLKARLVRSYSTSGLAGYTFVIANHSKEPMRLNPGALWVGKPNRAVLAQADSYTLASCKESGPETCATVLRLVVRGRSEAAPLLIPNESAASPFMRAEPGVTPNGGAK